MNIIRFGSIFVIWITFWNGQEGGAQVCPAPPHWPSSYATLLGRHWAGGGQRQPLLTPSILRLGLEGAGSGAHLQTSGGAPLHLSGD